MDILKVVKATRGPSKGRNTDPRKRLYLIVFDTVWMHRIFEARTERGDDRAYPDGTIEVQAKYAVVLTSPDDTNAICQNYATRAHTSDAEWAHDWNELPAAIERLRARHKGEPFPDEIDYVLDYPDHGYWKHMVEGAPTPEIKAGHQAFLDMAGRSADPVKRK